MAEQTPERDEARVYTDAEIATMHNRGSCTCPHYPPVRWSDAECDANRCDRCGGLIWDPAEAPRAPTPPEEGDEALVHGLIAFFTDGGNCESCGGGNLPCHECDDMAARANALLRVLSELEQAREALARADDLVEELTDPESDPKHRRRAIDAYRATRPNTEEASDEGL